MSQLNPRGPIGAPGGAAARRSEKGLAVRTLSRFLFGSALSAFLCGVVHAASFAYITNALSETVSVIDTARNVVVATVPVGNGPMGVAVNPSGTRVYVASLTTNSVAVIDTATNTVSATVPVSGSPIGVALNPAGTRVYVTTIFSNNVSVIDTATNAVVATIPVGTTPAGIAVNPSGTRAYVAIMGTGDNPGSTVQVIDTATNAVIANVAVGLAPQAVAVNPTGTRAYVTVAGTYSVVVIDTATNRVVGSIPVGGSPAGVAVNPSGTRIYVALFDTDRLAVIDTATNGVIANLAVGISPGGVAVTPTGSRVYVANFDSDNVTVVDTATHAIVATVPVGIGPFALGLFIGPDVAVAPPSNYQGMWAVPNLAEAGWGINFTHQGELIFASWFTYDANGKPWWLTMTAQLQGDGSFAGSIDQTSGPPFSAVSFDPARVTHNAVGNGRLSFSDANNGRFAYTVNGIAQVKTLARFQFATPVPVCTFNATLAPTQATNYQDMWAVPNLAESGWGINFTHQGDIIFASWFTYDASGKPWWVTATLIKVGTRTYAGALDATTGPPFNAEPFDPLRVTHSPAGNATVTFTDGANATFTYTLNGVTQTKLLTRFVFRTPGTVCQ